MHQDDAAAILNKFLADYQACQKQVRQFSGGQRKAVLHEVEPLAELVS